ncbi:39940_t:CDS:2, partial [Gigaspora margarita]
KEVNLSVENLESLEIYQELYNAQVEEEEEENKNDVESSLNIDLDDYNLDEEKETI